MGETETLQHGCDLGDTPEHEMGAGLSVRIFGSNDGER